MKKCNKRLRQVILLVLSLSFAACSSILGNAKVYVTKEDGLFRSQEQEVISCFDEAFNSHFCLSTDDFSKVLSKLKECKHGPSSIDLSKIKIYATMKDVGLVRTQENEKIDCKSPEFEGYLCLSGKDLEGVASKLRTCDSGG